MIKYIRSCGLWWWVDIVETFRHGRLKMREMSGNEPRPEVNGWKQKMESYEIWIKQFLVRGLEAL